jgi:hypothetical protein
VSDSESWESPPDASVRTMRPPDSDAVALRAPEPNPLVASLILSSSDWTVSPAPTVNDSDTDDPSPREPCTLNVSPAMSPRPEPPNDRSVSSVAAPAGALAASPRTVSLRTTWATDARPPFTKPSASSVRWPSGVVAPTTSPVTRR